MRLLTALAVAALLASAFLAPRHYSRREPALPMDRFVSTDGRAMAREGEAERALGIAMAGYERLIAERPDDLDALRGRIRTGLRIGSVGIGQPKVDEIVRAQANAYLQHRPQIDPDGSFLRKTVEEWVDGRLGVSWVQASGFYARTATSVYLTSRGDQAGRDMLFELARQGPFHQQFFLFARRYHPAWPGVEPLVRHYLENGDRIARVEASATLLDYAGLFGTGTELLDRYLPAIRSAVAEMLEQVRAFTDEGTSDAGRTTILALALLANRGEEAEMRMLSEAKDANLRFYAPFGDTVRIARLLAGFDDFSKLEPISARYKGLDSLDQEVYHIAAAHRAARLLRDGDEGAKAAGPILDIIEAAFDGPNESLRVFAMQAMLRLAPERGKAVVARAIDARGMISVYAGALADRVDDPVAFFLPAMESLRPDVAAIAAVSLLERPLPRLLQR